MQVPRFRSATRDSYIPRQHAIELGGLYYPRKYIVGNFVTLDNLNKLRFKSNPVPKTKLQRWCRDRILPARKFGGEWRVDLRTFDKPTKQGLDPLTAKVLSKLI